MPHTLQKNIRGRPNNGNASNMPPGTAAFRRTRSSARSMRWKGANGPARTPKSICGAHPCSQRKPLRATWRRPGTRTRSRKPDRAIPNPRRSCLATQPKTLGETSPSLPAMFFEFPLAINPAVETEVPPGMSRYAMAYCAHHPKLEHHVAGRDLAERPFRLRLSAPSSCSHPWVELR